MVVRHGITVYKGIKGFIDENYHIPLTLFLHYLPNGLNRLEKLVEEIDRKAFVTIIIK